MRICIIKTGSFRDDKRIIINEVKDIAFCHFVSYVTGAGHSEVYAGIIGEQEDFEEKGAESYRSEKIEEINETSEATIKEVMKRCISILYLDKYDTTSDFYEQFDKRLRRTISEIRGMN